MAVADPWAPWKGWAGGATPVGANLGIGGPGYGLPPGVDFGIGPNSIWTRPYKQPLPAPPVVPPPFDPGPSGAAPDTLPLRLQRSRQEMVDDFRFTTPRGLAGSSGAGVTQLGAIGPFKTLLGG